MRAAAFTVAYELFDDERAGQPGQVGLVPFNLAEQRPAPAQRRRSGTSSGRTWALTDGAA